MRATFGPYSQAVWVASKLRTMCCRKWRSAQWTQNRQGKLTLKVRFLVVFFFVNWHTKKTKATPWGTLHLHGSMSHSLGHAKETKCFLLCKLIRKLHWLCMGNTSWSIPYLANKSAFAFFFVLGTNSSDWKCRSKENAHQMSLRPHTLLQFLTPKICLKHLFFLKSWAHPETFVLPCRLHVWNNLFWEFLLRNHWNMMRPAHLVAAICGKKWVTEAESSVGCAKQNRRSRFVGRKKGINGKMTPISCLKISIQNKNSSFHLPPPVIWGGGGPQIWAKFPAVDFGGKAAADDTAVQLSDTGTKNRWENEGNRDHRPVSEDNRVLNWYTHEN